MAELVYTMLKKSGTEELHLFEGPVTERISTTTTKCTVPYRSICKGMTNDEKESQVFGCQSEDSARKLAAAKGRQVCGTCISHLYETYP